MPTHCKRGHPWTEANTAMRWRHGGKMFRVCKRCHADQSRLRYRSDPAFRESEKARQIANYRARTA